MAEFPRPLFNSNLLVLLEFCIVLVSLVDLEHHRIELPVEHFVISIFWRGCPLDGHGVEDSGLLMIRI